MNEQRKFLQKSQFETIGENLLARAPAKINLALLIADKRPDGYHNLETIMSKITFYDELLFQTINDRAIELVCAGLWSPPGPQNLVHKAASIFYEAIGKEPQIKITLTKNIPAGSGLGGASSDAATTLIALNKIHGNPLNYETLHNLTQRLGSDVSFFLTGPITYCTGRGEKMSKIDKTFPFSILLVLPDINSSTKMVYENFKVDLPLFNSLRSQINAHLSENRIDLILKMCANMLAKTAFALNNRLALLKVKIQEITKLPVLLSGSGSALFVVLDESSCQKTDFFQREIINSLGCNCIISFNNEW